MIFDMLPLKEYIHIYGKMPEDDDLDVLTQDFLGVYHTEGVDPFKLVGSFGIDWLELLLEHNVEKEEYEICSVFRDLINDFRNGI